MKTNNIINLLRAYCISNGRNLLVSLTSAFVFSILFSWSEGLLSMIYFVLIITSSLRIFGILDRPSTSIHYLSLPVSNLEKITVNFLLVNVVYVILFYFVMSIGALVGQVVYDILQGYRYALSEITWFSIYFNGNLLSCFCFLYASIAIAFLFSVIYKGRMGKAMLGFFAILIGLGIITGIVVMLNMKSVVPAGCSIFAFDWTSGPAVSISLSENVIESIFAIVIMGYCYVLSYLRLRETEA